jgi:hypothetical protein
MVGRMETMENNPSNINMRARKKKQSRTHQNSRSIGTLNEIQLGPAWRHIRKRTCGHKRTNVWLQSLPKKIKKLGVF